MSYDPYRSSGPTLSERRMAKKKKSRRSRLSKEQKEAEDRFMGHLPGDEPITKEDIRFQQPEVVGRDK